MTMLLLVLCLWMVCARRGVEPVQRQACEESKQESIRHHRMKIQTWRLASSVPMQAEYACAMTAASLTPQRRHADRRITPTQQRAHASQPRTCVCLVQKDMKESTQRNKQEHCMIMWEVVAVASGVACMARGRLLQVGLVALRRVLQWSKQNVAAKRPLPRCPSFKRPVRAILQSRPPPPPPPMPAPHAPASHS
jgi:hypothetical protein